MRFCLILFTVMLVGCASTKNPDGVYSAWIGKPSDDLLFSLGQPTNSFILSDGSKIFEYVHTKEVKIEDTKNIFSNIGESLRAQVDINYKQPTKLPEQKTVVLTCTVRFKVNASNLITNYVNSEDC